MIWKIVPHALAFVSALALALVLTPVVRELNRKLGIVDNPDPRRINKVPVPRGGGIAPFIAVLAAFGLVVLTCGAPYENFNSARFLRLAGLATVLAAIGFADDRRSMPPGLKLLGQTAVAFATWWWADLGFNDLWPSLPAWADCVLTVFWIIGAVNAFNLIDGLDGLARGLALIACFGMAGGLLFSGRSGEVVFYCAFMGAQLGFLRYNYNPASVFLGDSGSMTIGYTLAVLPLCSHEPNSFLVSVGVPLLAMGVPIFDTSLAILRRAIRRLMAGGGAEANVMTADCDHLHHRILRAVGFSQRKTAWILYAAAASLVAVGFLGMYLQSRAAGLWLATVSVAAVVVFRDMTRVELFDAGRLLNRVAHESSPETRRRWGLLTTPFSVFFDLAALVCIFFFCVWVMNMPLGWSSVNRYLVVRVAAMFAALVVAKTYVTVWRRAMASNYMRLFLGCAFGSIAGSIALYYIPSLYVDKLGVFTVLYAVLSFTALLFMRTMRSLLRDIVYAVESSNLKGRKDVSRVLVYGAGLRYRAFRRELVRTATANTRVIVGMIDDDILLRNHYIGGVRILGTLDEVPEIVNRVNADAVVIACDIAGEKLRKVRDTFAAAGVKVTQFSFSERSV